LDEKKINSDFFLHWLFSNEANQRIRNSAQGSVRESVSFTDFGAIPFPMPSIVDQEKIALALNNAKREVFLLKKIVDAYRQKKIGLMQKLMTGQADVKVPVEVN